MARQGSVDELRPHAQVVRSMREDVAGRKLAKGTVRRVLGFAAPYKRQLIVFLVLVVFSGIIGAANPLIYKEIINRGIIGGRTGLVVGPGAGHSRSRHRRRRHLAGSSATFRLAWAKVWSVTCAPASSPTCSACP